VAFARSHAAISTLVSARFEPSPSRGRGRPVMHVPTYTVANEMLERVPHGGKILCISPGKSEVGRLNGHRAMHFANKNVHIHYVVPATSTVALSDSTVDVTKTNDLRGFLQQYSHIGKYDAIFIPFALGQVFEECGSREETISLLRAFLRDDGGVFGLYYDVDDLRRYSLSEAFSGGLETAVLSDHPGKGTEGSVVTSVQSQIFWDYRITPERFLPLFPKDDECFIHAVRLYMADIHKPPPEFKRTALDRRLESVRVFRWFVKKEPMTFDPVINEICLPEPENLTVDVDPVLFGVEPNRGRPFNASDLFFVQPDRMFVTPKADGREVIVAWGDDNTAHCSIRGDQIAHSLPWKGPKGVAVQLELIQDAAGNPIYVLCDVLKGATIDTGYYARMHWFRRIAKDWGLDFIEFPLMVRSDSPQWPQTDRYPSDGFVLNFDFAPPGVFSSGYGAARYLKYRYTKEIIGEEDGLIYEAYCDTGAVVHDVYGQPKLRRDKLIPSSDYELEMLSKSWTVDKYRRIVTAACVIPTTLMKKIYQGPSKDGCYDFSVDELIYLWTPWRQCTIETLCFGMGDRSWLMALKSAMVNGLLKVTREAGHVVERPFLPAKRMRTESEGFDVPSVWGIPFDTVFASVVSSAIETRADEGDGACEK